MRCHIDDISQVHMFVITATKLTRIWLWKVCRICEECTGNISILSQRKQVGKSDVATRCAHDVLSTSDQQEKRRCEHTSSKSVLYPGHVRAVFSQEVGCNACVQICLKRSSAWLRCLLWCLCLRLSPHVFFSDSFFCTWDRVSS